MTPFQENVLGDARHLFHLLVENVIDYAVLFTDSERRVVSWNTGAERIMGWTAAEMIGRPADIIFVPEDRAKGEPDREAEKAARTGRAENERWHLRKDGSRYWGSGIMTALREDSGELRGFCKIFRDVTDQKRNAEELRDARNRLEAALLAGEIGTWTIDISQSRVTGDANLARLFALDLGVAADGADIEVYIAAIHEDDRPGARRAIAEALSNGGEYEAEFRVVLPDGSHRWISSRGKVARNDAGEAVSLYGAAVDITQRVHRERRERFLSELTAHTRTLLVPDDILYETARAVGEFTGAHRCLYGEIDDDEGTISIRRDYVQGRVVPSIAGAYPLAAFGPSVIESLRAGNVTIREDVETDPRIEPVYRRTFRELQFRAFLAVPLHKAGRWVAVLVLHQAHSRQWTQEEADLLTAVMERTWLAVENARLYRRQEEERERLRQRERNIAAQLQAGLQPPLPDRVPGLSLAQHIRAALDEAEVGGDFFDVFPLETGRTALVVGDLSGKGLAAAAQVATVRNMLRFAVYNGDSLETSIDRLNRTLVTNELVQGFATLFVGRYDSADRTLTYVNCGQEPALLRRAATGRIEELISTGSVLGGFSEARYREETVTLCAGDTLAVFTDGLTEAGPSRGRMLEIEGVAALLARHTAEEEATELAARLIAEVDAFAQGGIRDDVCLLVGIVEGDSP